MSILTKMRNLKDKAKTDIEECKAECIESLNKEKLFNHHYQRYQFCLIRAGIYNVFCEILEKASSKNKSDDEIAEILRSSLTREEESIIRLVKDMADLNNFDYFSNMKVPSYCIIEIRNIVLKEDI